MARQDIVIVGAKRTPNGAFRGCFSNVSAPRLGAAAIEALNIQSAVDDVIMGCVLTAGQRQAPARQAALHAGLDRSVACVAVNKLCGSGLQAIAFGYNLLMTGSSNAVIAGGMENMTQAPHLLHVRAGHKYGSMDLVDHIVCDGLEDAYMQSTSMGVLAQNLATQYNVSRQQQDDFALQSYEKAISAHQNGWFVAEIAAVNNVDYDETLNSVRPEKFSLLRPAFGSGGTITAASSSALSDGAAACLLMTHGNAMDSGLQPMARIVGYATHSQQPELFAHAPVGAIVKLLHKLGWNVGDVDLFEINEAFAVVPIVVQLELGIQSAQLNVHGGACALGHPLGASGARVLVTLLHALKQHNKKRGIAAVCIGGGEAIAMAIEVL